MSALSLVRPGPEHVSALKDYRREHFAAGETALHGASLLEEYPDCGDWLASLERLPHGWVPHTTFLGMLEGELVGMIDIRHQLRGLLREYGGHIGYGVRPTRRKRGYASQMLALALTFCREELHLDKAMLSCYKGNLASARTIQGQGGVLEREFVHTDGDVVCVYWITL